MLVHQRVNQHSHHWVGGPILHETSPPAPTRQTRPTWGWHTDFDAAALSEAWMLGPGVTVGCSWDTRPGKHTNNYGKSPCYSWENPLFRLGHFQVRKLLVITRPGNRKPVKTKCNAAHWDESWVVYDHWWMSHSSRLKNRTSGSTNLQVLTELLKLQECPTSIVYIYIYTYIHIYIYTYIYVYIYIYSNTPKKREKQNNFLSFWHLL